MKAFRAKYMVGFDEYNEPMYGYRDFDDAGVLLDCVAESDAEVWGYFVSKALAEANVGNRCWVLESLECVAM